MTHERQALRRSPTRRPWKSTAHGPPGRPRRHVTAARGAGWARAAPCTQGVTSAGRRRCCSLRGGAERWVGVGTRASTLPDPIPRCTRTPSSVSECGRAHALSHPHLPGLNDCHPNKFNKFFFKVSVTVGNDTGNLQHPSAVGVENDIMCPRGRISPRGDLGTRPCFQFWKRYPCSCAHTHHICPCYGHLWAKSRSHTRPLSSGCSLVPQPDVGAQARVLGAVGAWAPVCPVPPPPEEMAVPTYLRAGTGPRLASPALSSPRWPCRGDTGAQFL